MGVKQLYDLSEVLGWSLDIIWYGSTVQRE